MKLCEASHVCLMYAQRSFRKQMRQNMFKTKRHVTGTCIAFTSHIKIGPPWFLACCDVSKQLIRDSSFLLGLLFKKTKQEVMGGRSKAWSSASQQHISEVPTTGYFSDIICLREAWQMSINSWTVCNNMPAKGSLLHKWTAYMHLHKQLVCLSVTLLV